VTVERPLEVHWFLPTGGDGRSVNDFFPDPARRSTSARPPSFAYMRQVAQAADELGFTGVLTPTGSHCEDAWLMCAALAPMTERLKFLVAFRPGFVLPTLAGQMAASLQAISGGRALVNIVTGGDPVEQQKYGDFLDHDERYARTAEFLEVFRACWDRGGFSYEGRHFRVNGGGLNNGGDARQPLVYFGGASPAAEAVAARLVDVYLLWGEPPDWVSERIGRMRTLAAEEGRTLRFGIRLHVITRANEADAWAEADRLLSTMSKEDIEKAQANFARTQSVGQQRMTALHGGKADSLVVAPNLWAGIGLVRGGAGTALVGSHEQVAERIREYAALGIDTFILSGYPHLEECYVVGEELLPLLR
jgi:alkanesulfonate monooxygenase